jgi:hypothetical protein
MTINLRLQNHLTLSESEIVEIIRQLATQSDFYKALATAEYLDYFDGIIFAEKVGIL